ncbi:MAG: dihydrofolate reductase [Muribaculaceae bacterium]|nr:dihydrofolate reductase [Muribaculaceae bacterium]
MKKYLSASLIAMSIITGSCTHKEQATEAGEFDYTVDRFADIEVLRYRVPDFENLTLNQKILVYYLQEAALWGRDILWDQNNASNLAVRDLLENVYVNYQGDRDTDEFKNFEIYLKQVWFGNGIHHHYSTDKFTPRFSREFLENAIAALPADSPAPENSADLVELIFNPTIAAKRVNQAAGQDLIATSANNMYAPGVSQAEVEAYYAGIKVPGDSTPISYGLNSRIARDENGNIVEQTYRIGGLYGEAIEHIVANLDSASHYAENDAQRQVINSLIEFYRTGDLATFDRYSIEWAEDTASQVDFINGFIESYGDPLGMTGSWESIVNFKNNEASARTETLSANAQWFEDHSPVDPRFRKPVVKGVSAKVITAAILAGDSYPATPIGINLPNANWIRAAHGSKSVTLENITQAYDAASQGDGSKEEFVIDEPTRELMNQYLFITDNLHTDLHECLGHGSGQLLPGVDPDALREHGSTIEEARADLFALYYLADPKMVELGLIDNPEAYKAQYYSYILNGLMTQLRRIEPGKDIEEAHMRNRKLIAEWVYEKGRDNNVIELIKRDGKTFVKINDYEALRGLFGELLAEIQRVRSEGDYAAAAALVDNYGVKVDPELHAEVLERYSHLDIAPYRGFVNPRYTAVRDAQGRITDVTVTYDEDYSEQMLRYSREYRGLNR